MKTDLIFRQHLKEILEGIKDEEIEKENDTEDPDDIETYEQPKDSAGTKAGKTLKTFFSKKPEDDPSTAKNLIKHGGYNIAKAIGSIPALLLGKENIFYKAANFMKNPDIVELFKWSNVSKKTKDYPYEPARDDNVYISGIPGARKIRVGDTVSNLYGKIEGKKISVRRSYYSVKIIHPALSKRNVVSAQIDFSTLRLRPGKLFLTLKNGKQRVYSVNVTSPERHNWRVVILTNVDVNNIAFSPGLEDTSSIVSAGMMLNGYLKIKDWKTLGKDTALYLNLLIKIAATLQDPRARSKTLKQINDIMVTTQKTEGFEELDTAKKINTLNNALQLKIPGMGR